MIVETGVGIRDADAYVTAEYVTEYLTLRSRQTENGWDAATTAEREAAIVAGTDYIEKRFGHRFRGRPLASFEASHAEATITFSGLPLVGETLTLSDETYEFVGALTGLNGENGEILIGATPDDTAANVADAVNRLGGSWRVHATAASSGPAVTLAAAAPGAGGAFTPLSGTLSNVTIEGFSGGKDGGTQNLSWPRADAYDRHGVQIRGVPDLVRRANAEYAVRSLAGSLLPDPVDVEVPLKRKLERVGPLEEETEYQSVKNSETTSFPRYPSVDRLLWPLLIGTGRGVIRA